MEIWRKVWRTGIVPQLADTGLVALRKALMTDDPRLVQGSTCLPPALEAIGEEAVEGACAIGFCGWHGEGHAEVGSLEAFFERVCSIADSTLDDPGANRLFVDWFDSTPRSVMRAELLNEVHRELRCRAQMVTAR